MAVNATSGTSLNSSTGLGQGIDVNTFVQSALSFDQANINQLQTQQSIVDAQSKALSQITSDLNALESAVFSLKDPLGSLASQTAASSNTSVLTAAASSSALAGVSQCHRQQSRHHVLRITPTPSHPAARLSRPARSSSRSATARRFP